MAINIDMNINEVNPGPVSPALGSARTMVLTHPQAPSFESLAPLECPRGRRPSSISSASMTSLYCSKQLAGNGFCEMSLDAVTIYSFTHLTNHILRVDIRKLSCLKK